MSTLDDLGSAIAAVADHRRPVHRRHRPPRPRRRHRHRRRPGPDQRPQPARRARSPSPSPTADRPAAPSPASTATATSRSSTVDTAGATPIAWARRRRPWPSAPPVFGAAATTGGGVRVTVGSCLGRGPSLPRPGGRRIAGSVEHTAPLAPGSSGGALVDAEGRLVGLNTNRIGEGFYLALPADAALKARVEALGRGESPRAPRLGVAIAPSHVARRLRRSVGLPDRAGRPRPRRRGRLARRRGRASRPATSSCRPAAEPIDRRRRPARRARRARPAVRARHRARRGGADRHHRSATGRTPGDA